MKLKTIKPKSFDKVAGYPSDREKQYPTFRLTLEDFPLAKDWEVGKNYKIHMKVSQRELEVRKNGKGTVEFEILAIGGEAGNPHRYPRTK